MKAKIFQDKYHREFLKAQRIVISQKIGNKPFKGLLFQPWLNTSKIRNICIFSGRSRAIYSWFRCSRIFFKEQAHSKSLWGVQKQSWLLCSCDGIWQTWQSQTLLSIEFTGSNPVRSSNSRKIMIQPQSKLFILDNSGVLLVRCVRIENKSYYYAGRPLVLFLGVVLKLRKKNGGKLLYQRGRLVRCLFITGKAPTQNGYSGFFLKNYSVNGGVVLKSRDPKNLKLAGSRFLCVLPVFFKNKSFFHMCSGSFSSFI